MQAERLGILNGEGADAAGAGMDQDALPGFRPCPVHQSLHRRQADQRERGGFHMRERRGFAREEGLRQRDPLGEGPDGFARGPHEDLVARPEGCDVRSHGAHRAAGVEANGVWQVVSDDLLQVAGDCLLIDWIERGRLDVADDLVSPWHRVRKVEEPDDILNVAISRHHIGAHGRLDRSGARAPRCLAGRFVVDRACRRVYSLAEHPRQNPAGIGGAIHVAGLRLDVAYKSDELRLALGQPLLQRLDVPDLLSECIEQRIMLPPIEIARQKPAFCAVVMSSRTSTASDE